MRANSQRRKKLPHPSRSSELYPEQGNTGASSTGHVRYSSKCCQQRRERDHLLPWSRIRPSSLIGADGAWKITSIGWLRASIMNMIGCWRLGALVFPVLLFVGLLSLYIVPCIRCICAECVQHVTFGFLCETSAPFYIFAISKLLFHVYLTHSYRYDRKYK